MPKTKPNEPCVCGSGRKAKKCCGTKYQAPKPSPRLSLNGTMGLAGISSLICVTPFNSKKSFEPNPSGGPGFYKASFLLSKPSHAAIEENHLTFEFDQNLGDSHLFLGDPDEVFATITANLPDSDSILRNYTIRGYANPKGFLSKIEIESFEASSFQDASDKAFDALFPILSHLATLNNVPVYVNRWAIVELSTRSHMGSFTLPFVNMAAPVLDTVDKNSIFDKYSSLYREGLNSNSHNYQFLCFYKIIEGIRALRNDRTTKENQCILLTGKKPIRPREVLPVDPEAQQDWLSFLYGKQRWSDMAINQVFEGVAGRKINDIIAPNSELDTVRNKIAHTVLRDESKEPILIDVGAHIREVNHWLPLCRSLALYLLKKECPRPFGID